MYYGHSGKLKAIYAGPGTHSKTPELPQLAGLKHRIYICLFDDYVRKLSGHPFHERMYIFRFRSQWASLLFHVHPSLCPTLRSFVSGRLVSNWFVVRCIHRYIHFYRIEANFCYFYPYFILNGFS